MSLASYLAYDENNIKPGWIALVLVLLLALATFLLWRSMNTQLGRIKAPHKADLAEGREPAGHEPDLDDSPAGTEPPDDGDEDGRDTGPVAG